MKEPQSWAPALVLMVVLVSFVTILGSDAYSDDGSERDLRLSRMIRLMHREDPQKITDYPQWQSSCNNFITVEAIFRKLRQDDYNSLSTTSNIVKDDRQARDRRSNYHSGQSSGATRLLFGFPDTNQPLPSHSIVTRDLLLREKLIETNLASQMLSMNWTMSMINFSLAKIEESFSSLVEQYKSKIKWSGVNGDQFRKWIPSLDNLTYTLVDKKNPPKVNEYLRNITHYMEYFSCALEQMTYEELTKPTTEDLQFIFDNLDSSWLQVLCHTDQLISKFEDLSNSLVLINNDRVEELSESSVISMAFARLRSLALPGIKLLKSPLIERAIREKLPETHPASLHVDREFMPAETRNSRFCCRHERNLSILRELHRFLKYYRSTIDAIRQARLYDIKTIDETTRMDELVL